MKHNEILFLIFILIFSGESISQQNKDHLNKALFIAAQEGNTQTVKALIIAGADVNSKIEGRTPLHEASLNAPISTINELINAKAKLNIKDDQENTPLSLAASKLRLDVVELLILNGAIYFSGAILSVVDGFDFIYPKMTIEAGIDTAKKMIDLILEKGGDINEADKNGNTALIKAMDTYEYGDHIWFSGSGYKCDYHYPIAFIQSLVEKGADINKSDNFGRTPLMAAILSTNTDAIELLLNNDSLNLNMKDNDGKTALMHAINLNYHMKKTFLVSKFFKRSWAAPLYYDEHYREKEYMFNDIRQIIINWMVDDPRLEIDIKDNTGTTALSHIINFHWKTNYIPYYLDDETIRNVQIQIIKRLLIKGADINVQNGEGKSPLVFAVEKNDTKIQELLINTKRAAIKAYRIKPGEKWQFINETDHQIMGTWGIWKFILEPGMKEYHFYDNKPSRFLEIIVEESEKDKVKAYKISN